MAAQTRMALDSMIVLKFGYWWGHFRSVSKAVWPPYSRTSSSCQILCWEVICWCYQLGMASRLGMLPFHTFLTVWGNLLEKGMLTTALLLLSAFLCLCLGYLHDNYILLALAGHNEYLPPAQELSAMLPDGFSVGLFGWSKDYNYGCEIKTTATCHEVMSCPPSPSSV